MAESKIEWTDSTWNPVAGCSLASAGCKNCYAMNMARRLESMGVQKYRGLTSKRGKRITWTGKITLDPDSLETPLKWKKPRKVFVNSMSDLFHEDVNDEFIHRVWKTMQLTPHHSYQILTKRPERMREVVSHLDSILPNVWLGTSVEGASVVDRIDALRDTSAAVRFVSFEPLIESVGEIDLKGIHWAIVGGESGPNARPISEDWIDEIHEQCMENETSFFFKQWGSWGADNKKRSKKANGREYKGQQWDEMPVQVQI